MANNSDLVDFSRLNNLDFDHFYYRGYIIQPYFHHLGPLAFFLNDSSSIENGTLACYQYYRDYDTSRAKPIDWAEVPECAVHWCDYDNGVNKGIPGIDKYGYDVNDHYIKEFKVDIRPDLSANRALLYHIGHIIDEPSLCGATQKGECPHYEGLSSFQNQGGQIDNKRYQQRAKLYSFLIQKSGFLEPLVYPLSEFRRFVRDYLLDMIKRHNDLLSWLVFAKLFPRFIYPDAFPYICLTEQSIEQFNQMIDSDDETIKQLIADLKSVYIKRRTILERMSPLVETIKTDYAKPRQVVTPVKERLDPGDPVDHWDPHPFVPERKENIILFIINLKCLSVLIEYNSKYMHYLHNAIHDYVAINLHRNQEDYENDDIMPLELSMVKKMERILTLWNQTLKPCVSHTKYELDERLKIRQIMDRFLKEINLEFSKELEELKLLEYPLFMRMTPNWFTGLEIFKTIKNLDDYRHQLENDEQLSPEIAKLLWSAICDIVEIYYCTHYILNCVDEAVVVPKIKKVVEKLAMLGLKLGGRNISVISDTIKRLTECEKNGACVNKTPDERKEFLLHPRSYLMK